MGGVGPNLKWIANGPGYGAGTWEEPRGQYGVAQLSPWFLFPLDGLNLKHGTSGELFGYGYLPLPLTNPKAATVGPLHEFREHAEKAARPTLSAGLRYDLN